MILTNATLATMDGPVPYGRIERGAIALAGDRIAWVGAMADAPEGEALDLGGRLVTPGLIDCHTHIVHGGNRAREFELRLEGASYEEIARAGGGIVSTVAATRVASEDDLLASALPRVDTLIGEGVCTIEIKSGYGLDIATELKMLRVARRIGVKRPIRVHTSFLGAHALPPEYKDRAVAYLAEVCLPALDAAHAEALADAVDGFC
jgi:imidazolonepropionase